MSSDFLFAMPTFFRGAGAVLDLGGTAEEGNYNVSKTPKEADIRAIASDWLVVGNDIHEAVKQVEAELDKEE